jgi:DNA-binding response OmpR family regulator
VSHEEWEKWPLIASPHGRQYIRLLFALSSSILRFLFACTSRQASLWKPGFRTDAPRGYGRYTAKDTPIPLAGTALAEVGILIIDDDIVSQRALKNVLDSEGWRVRIVPLASAAMLELASGQWSLVIVNIAMTDVRGPLFNILKDLAQGDADAIEGTELDTARPKRIRVLFLVPLLAARDAQPILEKEGLPYLLKPYHLHDFLEKVGELLVEAGAIADPIRSMSDFSVTSRKRRGLRSAQRGRRSSMFASRDDYQMSEEELLEWERTEEEDRKKREKELKDREHL